MILLQNSEPSELAFPGLLGDESEILHLLCDFRFKVQVEARLQGIKL